MKRKLIVALVALLCLTSFSGCLRKKTFENRGASKSKIIQFYGLYDDPSIYEPAIKKFETANREYDVQYKKFTDPEKYLDLIINELAEGEGPDVFLMHNTWFPKHYKKLIPAPEAIANTEIFNEFFVDVTGDDLIIPDEEGVDQIWGLPIYVDTLALYYNNDHFEEAIPSRGKPSLTWAGIESDIQLLTREDNSINEFERSGIAMGRLDNVAQGYELLLAMLLQSDVNFYNSEYTEVAFRNNQNAIDVLELFTSFASPTQKNYSWNEKLSDPNSSEKDLTAFALGEVSMIPGFSFTYDDIVTEINRQKKLGKDTIAVSDIKVTEIPQIIDPRSSTETRDTLASYFAPVVARTTEHSAAAWDFISTLVQEQNLREMNEMTHRPSARRSLINEQKTHPIYGPFAAQIGYAHSIAMPDAMKFEEIFTNIIERMVDGRLNSRAAINDLASDIQDLIPTTGVKPEPST